MMPLNNFLPWRRTRPQLGVVALLVFGALCNERSFARPIVAGYDRFYSGEAAPAAEAGMILLQELACVACHQAPVQWREILPNRGLLSLATVGSRLDEDVLQQFVTDPQGFNPGTTMPRLLERDDAGGKDSRALAAYLATLRGQVDSFRVGDGNRGRELYHSVGCVACHAPEQHGSGLAIDAEGGRAVPLVLGRHYTPEALGAFLKDPLSIRSAGSMPSFELSPKEAADLAAYLIGHKRNSSRGGPASASAELIDQGRRKFSTLGCVACHETGEAYVPYVAPDLDQLDSGQGCLAPSPSVNVPDYSLDDAQRQALAIALVSIREPPPLLSPAEQVHSYFARLNCYACHEWRGKGGPMPDRDRFFGVKTASAESIGEFGRLPPRLDEAGWKLSAAWLERLLAGSEGGVRPHMATRMPRYGHKHASILIPALQKASRPETPIAIDTSGRMSHQRSEAGRRLLGTGKGGLGCISCHGLRGRPSLGVPLLDLTSTVDRLAPEYFKALLLSPQEVQPGTLMPPLFAGRPAPNKDVEAIWTYLKEMGQGLRLPDGMEIAEDYELRPQEEGRPIVLRTFLRGAGTHAIAIGFPEGVHVAFDADHVRWALAWRGRFLSALSTWEERAARPAVPLGEDVRALPIRVALVRRDGSETTLRFTGYRLEGDGTPVMLYTVGSLTVEDSIRPYRGGLRRILQVSGDGHGWAFQNVSGEALQALAPASGVMVFEEEIRF